MRPRHAVFHGTVAHVRFGPVRHQFSYRLSMIGLDLDDLGSAFRGRWLWSVNRPNVAAFHRADYLRGGNADLATAIRDLVEAQTGARPQGRVQLVAQPRYFGLCFNPISLFLCHGPDGALEAIVAEVHNTPWGERHPYVLPLPGDCADRAVVEFDKALHVSPFMPMDLRYRFTLARAGDRVRIALDAYRAGERVFSAGLRLHERPMTARALAGVLLATPFMTAKVLATIYWEALRLWLKRVPYISHPIHGT